VVFRGDPQQGSFLAGYYSGGTLKAAATLGMKQELIRLGELLEAGRSVEPAELADPGFDLLAIRT